MPLSPSLIVSCAGRRFPVASFEDASRLFCATRDRLGVGASQTPRTLILDGSGKVVAHVSYNGRVWPGEHWTAGDVPLFDPIQRAA